MLLDEIRKPHRKLHLVFGTDDHIVDIPARSLIGDGARSH